MIIIHPTSDRGASPVYRSLVVGVALFALSACSSSDEPVTDPVENASEAKAENTADSKFTLPDFFPVQIPLPDDYLIVRNSSLRTDEHGREIELNIALPGSLEEWQETYQSALQAEFQDIEFREHRGNLQWRFHGHGFEYAVLYLGDNEGHLDRGSTDSTHLPVLLSLKMVEIRPGQ